jgi:hypothetical protein
MEEAKSRMLLLIYCEFAYKLYLPTKHQLF